MVGETNQLPNKFAIKEKTSVHASSFRHCVSLLMAKNYRQITNKTAA
jgi:hypothetical protein